jgi:diguanylate cyclase (GGDEF)-like protein
MNTQTLNIQRLELTAGIAYTLLVALVSFLLRRQPELNVVPLALGVTVLLAGYSWGPIASWLLALTSGLFSLGLYNFDMISLPVLLSSLACFTATAVYPLPWHLRHTAAEGSFNKNLAPLKDARDLALEQMKKSKIELDAGKQRAKESDSLFLVAREIAKVLTLRDMSAFISESVESALKKRRNPKPGVSAPRFVLLLVDEESRRFKVAACTGLPEMEAAGFEAPLEGPNLVAWLGGQAKALHLTDVHEDPALRRLQMPRHLKSIISIPLVIKGELMGLVLAFDMVPGAFTREDFNDLRVLGNQFSIGVKKAILYDKVQRLSITDGLTGLYVHRYLQERLEEEVRRAARYNSALSFIMIDIDFFKRYNDNYGHQAGDAVLKRVAKVLAQGTGGGDFVARYGGEEFAVVLPGQSLELAQAKAEALRKAVEKEQFTFEGQSTQVTISGGLASFPEDALTKNGLIDRADQALYQAKARGRNQWVHLENEGA